VNEYRLLCVRKLAAYETVTCGLLADGAALRIAIGHVGAVERARAARASRRT
jgi:hypothetical protein